MINIQRRVTWLELALKDFDKTASFTPGINMWSVSIFISYPDKISRNRSHVKCHVCVPDTHTCVTDRYGRTNSGPDYQYKTLIIKDCFHRQLFFTSTHLQCSVQGYSSFGTIWTPIHVGWDGSKWAYRTQRPRVHTMTMSPDCFPSMRSLQQVPTDHQEWWRFTRYSAFFLSLPRLIRPSVHNSFLFINLSSCSSVSWDCVSVSCLSASRWICIMSRWRCTTQHSLGCRPSGQ